MSIKLKIRLFRLILWLGLAGLVLFLLSQVIVPFGNITYVYDFQHRSDFIQKLTPESRLSMPGKDGQIIFGDPVYFSLRLPRGFDNAKLTVKYKNESKNLSVIETGTLLDNVLWNYDLQPIQNKTIDDLFKTWVKIREGKSLFLQRKSNYASLSQFLLQPPSADKIAVYNYRLPKNFFLSNYQPSAEYHNLNYSLRSAYQFYTYLGIKEEFNFLFSFQDLNINKSADKIEINIYDQNDNLVGKRVLEDDDREKEGSGQVGQIFQTSIRRSDLPAGPYKVEVKTSDDIITINLITHQNKLAFINKLWLSNVEQSSPILYTDSQVVSLQTSNPNALQKAWVNGRLLDVIEPYRQFSLVNRADINEVRLEKGDIIIFGQGVFGFNRNNLFNPNYKTIDNYFQMDDYIDYVVADYKSPIVDGEWNTAVLDFDLSKAYREDGKYGFIISIPGLRADDEIEDKIILKEIKIELSGKTLWEKIKEKK